MPALPPSSPRPHRAIQSLYAASRRREGFHPLPLFLSSILRTGLSADLRSISWRFRTMPLEKTISSRVAVRTGGRARPGAVPARKSTIDGQTLISISRAASRTPRPQDGPAFIRSRKAAGSTGPSGPHRRNAPTRASAAQKAPSAMTKICPVRCRLAGGVSGFGDGGCSVGVCMDSFRFGGFTTPEAPAMQMRKKAENACSPARYMINRRPCWSKIASMSSTSVVASTAAPSPAA